MIGVKYISWRRGSGYGDAARRHMLGLRRLGIPVTWVPMVPGRSFGRGLGFEGSRARVADDPELDDICNIPIPYDTVIIHLPPEYFPPWARRETGKRIVGHTVWETDRVPPHWPPLFQSLQLAIVPCEWNREVFRGSGIAVPIKVVPHSLEPTPITSTSNVANCDAGIEDIDPSDFVFYTINTWTNRKRVEKTMEAYLNEFTADDSVALIVKTSTKEMSWSRVPFSGHSFIPADWLAQRVLRRYKRPASVCLIAGDDLPEARIRAIHRRGDCYVSLCAAEGWGVGVFDAAARGRPVVMTGYGGQREFLPPNLAYLVDYYMEPVWDGPLNFRATRGQKWAAPDVGHASQLMRRVFEHREEATQRGRALGEFVRAKFHTDRVDRMLVEALS